MGDLYFTELPDASGAAPLPIRVLARCVRLCPGREPRVLVLGYGLGTLGALLAALRPKSRILGIELSRDYVRDAAAHAPRNVELRRDDAARFLRSTAGRFDLVIDDCFQMVRGEPVRIAALDRSAPRVRRRLRPGGLYVRNLLPDDDDALERHCRDMRAAFPHVVHRRFRDWDNVLAIASARSLGAPELARLAHS